MADNERGMRVPTVDNNNNNNNNNAAADAAAPPFSRMEKKRRTRWGWLPPKQDWDLDLDRHLNPFVPRSQTRRLPRPLAHFLGHRDKAEPDVGNVLVAFWSCAGTFCGLLVVTALFRFSRAIHDLTSTVQGLPSPVIFASLGATAILDYNAVRSPLAQPRAAICGHTLSVVTGIALTKLFVLRDDFESIRWLVGPFVCGVSSAVMTLTNSVHPPGGATALLAAVDPTVTALGWWFAPLIILGSVLMLLVALLMNNIQRQYPVFWWTPKEVGRPPKMKDDEESVGSAPQVDVPRQPSVAPMQRLSGMSQLLGLRTMVAVSCDSLMLPPGFSIEPEEKSALIALQERLRSWAQEEHLPERSSYEGSQCDGHSPGEGQPAAHQSRPGSSEKSVAG
jgi:hypothetical protein